MSEIALQDIFSGDKLQNIFNYVLKNNGKIAGVIPITIFASSATIGTSEQTVWRAGATQAKYIPKFVEDTCTIVSTSVQDTMTTGTGIWTVKVSGINGEYEFIQEVVELNGTTPVALVNKYLAINEMNPELAGTALTAQGRIDVKYSDGNILATIPPTATNPFNISFQGVFTVPDGITFKINKFAATSGSGDEVTVNMFVINPLNKIPIMQQTLLMYQSESSPLDGSSITIPEKHTMIVNAFASVGTNRQVSISIAGDLIVNSIFAKIPERSL
jgi:hypothetical protein